MTRAKGGIVSQRKHKKVLALTKGHRGTKHSLYKRANESMMKSLSYSYRDRKDRKGDFRSLWITRINAAARINGISYSRLMDGLKNANVDIDRKILADMAISDPAAFTRLVEIAKAEPAAAE